MCDCLTVFCCAFSGLTLLVGHLEEHLACKNFTTPILCPLFKDNLDTVCQKDKTSLDLNEARDDGILGCSGISWTICKQSTPHYREITTRIPHR